jgi:hypothetical protein
MSQDKDEIVKMAREAGLWVTGFPTEHIEHFAALCRAPLVAENAALKEQLKALGVYNESTKVELARVQAVAEWQGSVDGGKIWGRIDKPRGESIESRVAYLRNMTNSQGRPIYLIRALYTTPQPAAQEPTSAVPVVEPVAWSHGCNALCANIDLWISSCPHCGKPRPAAPVPQEQT